MKFCQNFKEILNDPNEVLGTGDVKYHLGVSTDREFENKKIHLTLSPNPSHLEAVNPVAIGKVRAKQTTLNDKTNDKDNGFVNSWRCSNGRSRNCCRNLCDVTVERI